MKPLFSLSMLAIGIGVWGIVPALSQKTAKNSHQSALLSGSIHSASGQELEGVTVSARAEGSTITTSVFTDSDGLYIFPQLDKGKYQVWAQTVGFDTARSQVDLNGSAVGARDFILKTASEFTITRQMTGADWFNSMPEDTDQDREAKDLLNTNCAGCHQPNFALQNRFDKRGWVAVMDLMKMVNTIGVPSRKSPLPILQHHEQELGDYLAKVDGLEIPSMKTNFVSRPKGDATLAVITEYAIDPAETPGEFPVQDGNDWSQGVPSSMNGARGTHDAEIDFAGNIWVVNSQGNATRTYAEIDTKTGKVTSYKILDASGKVQISHGLRKDANGILWFNVHARGKEGPLSGLARLDPVSGKVDVFNPPQGMSDLSGNGSIDVDGKGKVWASADTGALRFDPDTKKFTEFRSITYKKDGTCYQTACGMTYGVAGDSEGNGYWAQMALDIVGKSDVATGKSLEIKFPPQIDKLEIVTPEERKVYEELGSDWGSGAPYLQGPRRLSGDHKGNAVWVADSWGNTLAKIDIHTNKVTMYPAPTKYAGIYSTVVDKNHTVWANMMNNDSVGKFDPATGKWTEYMLPTHGAEPRHIAIDDRQGPTEVVIPYSRTSKVALMRFRTRQDLQVLKDLVKAEGAQAANR